MKKTKIDSSNKKKKRKRPIIAFWRKHRKCILISTGIMGAIILAFLGIKTYWNATSFERWLEKASLNEARKERDNIHNQYLNYKTNDEHRKFLWDLLSRLDKRISELEWDGKIPTCPSYPREHGHNLYKPD